jgi:hypothetical protein
MTRRQWERDYFADLFMVFGMSIGGIAAKVKGIRRYSLAVTLKGRRVVSNLPEIQADLDEAWARLVPSKKTLDQEWERTKMGNAAMRALGRAFGKSCDQIAADVLRGKVSA